MPFWRILIFILIVIAVLLMFAGQWRVFQKLGKPGWAALVPVYNMIVLLQAIGRPVWWILLLAIPLIDVIIVFIIITELVQRFGKGRGFAFGIALLPFIFYPILGFSRAEYDGPLNRNEMWEEEEES